MAPRKNRPKYDLGRKVALWLADQKVARRKPSSVAGLARRIGLTEGGVRAWIEQGKRPRSDTLRDLAEVMGADMAWLADDSKPYPPPDAATSLAVLLKMLPEAEQRTLAEALRDPVERRAFVASWSARRGRP